MADNTLLSLVKQSLSIISTATAKDTEIQMWIDAGEEDMKRQGILVDNLTNNCLVQGAIVMFVKGHFGFVEEREKELALRTYKSIVENLSLSQEFVEVVE